MTTAAPDPRLDRAGTSEAAWIDGQLDQLTDLPIRGWRRAVVIGPHPDDEVLGAGGLMQRLSSGGTPVTLLSATDGEASHPRSPTVTRAGLAARRAGELRQALDLLGLERTTVVRLSLADGAVGAAPSELTTRLDELLGPDVICIAPWSHDGHPDHDATGRVAARACAASGAALVSYLVWTWHWAVPGDHRVPWSSARRLRMSRPERARKRSAIGAFRSQIVALGDGPGDEAILDAGMLDHFGRSYEVFLTE